MMGGASRKKETEVREEEDILDESEDDLSEESKNRIISSLQGLSVAKKQGVIKKQVTAITAL